nr:lytic murein transglycosylase [Pseudonocardia sp. C8]
MAAVSPGCRFPWYLAAGIGKVESEHARGGDVDAAGNTLSPILGPQLTGSGGTASIVDTDGGTLDGDPVWDRAIGPTQFIPSTWEIYRADGNDDGRSDPHNVFDAAAATGLYMCAGGLDMVDPAQLHDAVFRYNHSETYVEAVLGWARAYAAGTSVLPDRSGAPSRRTILTSPLAALAAATPTGAADRPLGPAAPALPAGPMTSPATPGRSSSAATAPGPEAPAPARPQAPGPTRQKPRSPITTTPASAPPTTPAPPPAPVRPTAPVSTIPEPTPGPAAPGAAGPDPAGPDPAGPIPAGPTPAHPIPTDPTPTTPEPNVPESTTSKPADPEPTPTAPGPTGPAPVSPAPALPRDLCTKGFPPDAVAAVLEPGAKLRTTASSTRTRTTCTVADTDGVVVLTVTVSSHASPAEARRVAADLPGLVEVHGSVVVALEAATGDPTPLAGRVGRLL